MSREISELLRDATPMQAIAPDLHTIEEAAMQRRAVKGGLGIAAIVAVGAMAATNMPTSHDSPPVIDTPPTEIVETPADSTERGPIILGADQRLIGAGVTAIEMSQFFESELVLVWDVPEDYFGTHGFGVEWATMSTGPDADFRGAAMFDITDLPADLCNWKAGTLGIGLEVQDLADGLVTLHPDAMTETVTLDGHDGLVVSFSLPDDLDVSDCDGPSDTSNFAGLWFVDGGGLPNFAVGPGQAFKLWILDVDGERLAIQTSWMPPNSEADVDEVHDMVEGTRIMTRTEWAALRGAVTLLADQRLIEEPGPVLIDVDTHLHLSTGLFATMEAPPQWQAFLGHTLMEVTTIHGRDSDQRQVAIWNVTALPPDPCRWQAQGERNRVTAGATAQELARQFFELRTDATEPVPTSLAGFDGWYVEIDVPDDVSFDDCDKEQDSSRYMGWYVQEGLQRYHQAPGQSHRLWVLDVNGQPLVVEASWTSNNTAEEIDEVLAVVETLGFGPPPT